MSLGTIVIIEDEAAIREAICDVVTGAGYEPVAAADGPAGLDAARRPDVRLVLLDLMLPQLDGMDLLAKLRQTHPTLPVIIITARGTEDDRVDGLRSGADDYIVKPFSAKELMARVEAVLRRSPERPPVIARIVAGKASVDLQRREITRPGSELVTLSETESEILSHLAENSGRAISREEILTRVWGLSGGGIETRTIDMHIARLRAKLAGDGDGESGEQHIATVRGKGYMLAREVRVERSRPGASSGA
jgi:DNA-binding response OmpR family regulator